MAQYNLPPGYELKKKKPIYKRVWFWLLAVVLFFIIIAVATGGDDDSEATVVNTAPSTGAVVPGDQGGSTAPVDDPLSDGGWTASDIQVSEDQFGGNQIIARITNNEDDSRTGSFTLTIFKDGNVVGSADGFASDVEAGSTATVDFFSLDEIPDGPYTFELQNDF